MKKITIFMTAILAAIMMTACGSDDEKHIGGTQNEEIEQSADSSAPTFSFFEDFEVEAGDTVAYKSHVTAEDDSGKEPTINVDTSKVDIDAPGEYPVTYTAVDEAGNEAKVEVTITVTEPEPYSEKKIGPLCDDIIASECTSGMSQYEIAEALYWWCKNNIKYTSLNKETYNIWEGASDGITMRRGDCFTYYATYAALLTRAGIENKCVERYNGPSPHYWNLVNFGDGWYHCDTGPGSSNYRITCFMQTDAQLESYDAWDEECHEFYQFDPSTVPERATKIIYGPTTYGE